MQFAIKILTTSVETKMNSKGKPNVWLEVAYKNQLSGKVESKKLVDWANPDVFKALGDAKANDEFTIVSEKEGDFWQWKSATAGAPTYAPPTARAAQGVSAGATKSTYETSEERARKQVLIVKQSSLAQAIDLLSIGAKAPPSRDLVLQEAQAFVDWVFEDNKPQETLVDMPNDDFPD